MFNIFYNCTSLKIDPVDICIFTPLTNFFYFLGFSNDGGVGFGASCDGPGVDKSK